MTNISGTDRFALRLIDLVLRRRWWVIAASVLVVFAIGSGARFLGMSNNYSDFFSPDNPELTTFEAFQDTYTKNDNILFVVRPEEGDVFAPRVAEAIERITEESWQIPFVLRVDSITNFQHSWADGDDLTVEDLIRDGGSLSEAEFAAKREVVMNEPLLHGNLVSLDGRTTGVNVTLQYPEKSLTEVPAAAAVAREIADGIRAEYPDMKIVISGVSMLNNAFAESGQQDAMTLVPFMYVVLILGMVITLRSISGTVATLVIIALSTIAAMGFAGFAGIKLTPISLTAPTIILTLAIADSVHILLSMRTFQRLGMGKIPALRESFRINFLAVSITSITTIVGFLSLNFSDAPPFWHLGNITAFGIGSAWMLSMTVLPALVSMLPMRVRQSANGGRSLDSLLGRLGRWVTARHRPLLIGMGLTVVFLLAMVPTIELNDEWVKYFDKSVTFRTDTEYAIENLTGVYTIDYSIPSGEPSGISNPEYLKNLAAYTSWLREQPEVRHVYSYADIIRRLNKNLHGDDPAWYRLPEDAEMAAQYLLLYELSLPYGLDLNDRINIDKSATRVTATVADLSTVDTRRFIDRTEAWLVDNVPERMQAKATGAAVMFSHISKRNIESMLRGNAIAIVLIAFIMYFALRSRGLALLSVVSNAVPILMTFGIWALFVGKVGMAAATVTATSLGIVVDDTVHFLSKYRRARNEKGLPTPKAIHYAFETVGTPIVVTTVVLSFGFAVLAASTFRINAEMGLLTALAILTALVVDFFLLPAILMIGHKEEAGQQAGADTQVDTQKGTSREEISVAPAG